MWQKLMWKIWMVEGWIYRMAGIKEGAMLPWWAIIIHHLFHPSLMFRWLTVVHQVPHYNMVHVYGVDLSFEFLKFEKGKFRNGLVAYRRYGEWEYWDMKPGTWVRVYDGGLDVHPYRVPVNDLPLPEGDTRYLLDLIDRIKIITNKNWEAQ